MTKQTTQQAILATLIGFSVPMAFAQQAAHCTYPGNARNPDNAYIIYNSGTVTDTRTDLMWDRCSWGQSGAACDGLSASFNWSQMNEAVVAANAQNYKGYSDWRVPNFDEIKTLVESCRMNPAINNNVFPNTPPNWYWSMPVVPTEVEDTAGVYFFDGYAYGYGHRNNQGFGRIRLVRDAR
ncbi:DUF1566 domain-containing protein [Salinispirillum marinum]|uniref:DUF1566 domain-containing protein n=2 Tax=Saccharospirillaceae TaxID=255527 RepID=A0ABV8BFH6_9GAMM